MRNLSQIKIKSAEGVRSTSGFTLIETFVAITVLMLAIMGPLALFSRAIGDATSVKNQMIAYYLAQEGLELAINKMDSNRTEGGVMVPQDRDTWLTDLKTDCFGDTAKCRIYYDMTDGVKTDNRPTERLYINKTATPGPANFLYHAILGGGDSQTIFSRAVNINQSSAGAIQAITQGLETTDLTTGGTVYDSELILLSTVTWREKGRDKSISLRTILTN